MVLLDCALWCDDQAVRYRQRPEGKRGLKWRLQVLALIFVSTFKDMELQGQGFNLCDRSWGERASVLLPVVFRCMMKYRHAPLEAE
jgi:hypothetical protein